MTRAAKFSLVLLLAGAAAAQGIRPRRDLADYQARSERDGVSVGAALLSPDQVRNTFASGLNRAYVVVEVTIQPSGVVSVDVAPSDFTLRITGTSSSARPANPRAVAANLQKGPASSPSPVDIYPSVGVGYESGPRQYDPVTGRTRGGGVYTSAGVGVGVGGGDRPASTDQDRKTMDLELSEKSLPEGVTSKPVAGYLYFPLVAKKKNAVYELEYYAQRGKMTLLFPPMGK